MGESSWRDNIYKWPADSGKTDHGVGSATLRLGESAWSGSVVVVEMEMIMYHGGGGSIPAV